MSTLHKAHVLPGHAVETAWRAARAGAIEATSSSLSAAIDHLADAEAAVEDDFPQHVETMRAAAAVMRSMRNDLDAASRELRAVDR